MPGPKPGGLPLADAPISNVVEENQPRTMRVPEMMFFDESWSQPAANPAARFAVELVPLIPSL